MRLCRIRGAGVGFGRGRVGWGKVIQGLGEVLWHFVRSCGIWVRSYGIWVNLYGIWARTWLDLVRLYLIQCFVRAESGPCRAQPRVSRFLHKDPLPRTSSVSACWSGAPVFAEMTPRPSSVGSAPAVAVGGMLPFGAGMSGGLSSWGCKGSEGPARMQTACRYAGLGRAWWSAGYWGSVGWDMDKPLHALFDLGRQRELLG